MNTAGDFLTSLRNWQVLKDSAPENSRDREKYRNVGSNGPDTAICTS